MGLLEPAEGINYDFVMGMYVRTRSVSLLPPTHTHTHKPFGRVYSVFLRHLKGYVLPIDRALLIREYLELGFLPRARRAVSRARIRQGRGRARCVFCPMQKPVCGDEARPRAGFYLIFAPFVPASAWCVAPATFARVRSLAHRTARASFVRSLARSLAAISRDLEACGGYILWSRGQDGALLFPQVLRRATAMAGRGREGGVEGEVGLALPLAFMDGRTTLRPQELLFSFAGPKVNPAKHD